MLLLAASTGFAAEDKKAPPVNTETSSVKPEKAPAAPTDGEQINWHVISSGGTKGASPHFGLDGTVAQPAVDSGSSTHYKLISGFWALSGPVGCCVGIRGNVDGITGPAGDVDVSDLTFLVAYLFSDGAAPPCVDEGNVDGVVGSAGPIDVADLTYLVAYFFQGGPTPSPCP